MPNMSEAARLTYHVLGNGMHIHISEWRERRRDPKAKVFQGCIDGATLADYQRIQESPWRTITHHSVTLIIAYSPELHRVYYDPAKQTYFAMCDWMEAPDSDCILLGKVGPQ